MVPTRSHLRILAILALYNREAWSTEVGKTWRTLHGWWRFSYYSLHKRLGEMHRIGWVRCRSARDPEDNHEMATTVEITPSGFDWVETKLRR